MTTNTSEKHGIEAEFGDLVRARPNRALGGFAPGGKVRTHQFGNNRSVFRGRGMEFDESRVYQPGDDVRSIDWRVTARTGTMHTKLFHEERERPVFILLDQRASMKFGTRKQFKSVLAAEVAAKLAWTGLDGGDRVGGFIIRPDNIVAHPARRNHASVLTFLKAMSDASRLDGVAGTPGDTGEPTLAQAVERLRQVARPGTLVFVISDFTDLDTAAERGLNRLSLHAHVTAIMTHDPLDAALPRGDGRRVSDGHAATALSGLSKATLDNYASAFAERREHIKKLARKRGMAFLDLSTADDAGEVLHPHRRRTAPLQARMVA